MKKYLTYEQTIELINIMKRKKMEDKEFRLTNKEWDNIAFQIGTTNGGQATQSAWYSLRDRYKKLSRDKQNGKIRRITWEYYDYLKFLNQSSGEEDIKIEITQIEAVDMNGTIEIKSTTEYLDVSPRGSIDAKHEIVIPPYKQLQKLVEVISEFPILFEKRSTKKKREILAYLWEHVAKKCGFKDSYTARRQFTRLKQDYFRAKKSRTGLERSLYYNIYLKMEQNALLE